MRYRVIQYFDSKAKPIYADLEVEGESYRAPQEIEEEKASVQKGNWIEASEAVIPDLLKGQGTLAGLGSAGVAGTE